MTVNLYFIRHGYSMANDHRNHTLPVFWPLMVFNWKLRNARLHPNGLRDSGNVTSKLYVDRVFCSPSARCVETAYLMFVSNNVCDRVLVAPYLRERIALAFENHVFPYAQIKDPIPKVCDATVYADTEDMVHGKPGDLLDFVKWGLRTGMIKDGESVAVVTHSVTIMRQFGLSELPKNNSIWHVELTETGEPVRALPAAEQVYDGFTYEKKHGWLQNGFARVFTWLGL